MIGKVLAGASLLMLVAAGSWRTGDGTVASASGSGSATAATAYVAPLPEPLHVLHPFDPPDTPYGPGHLGVDLSAARGAVVRAAGAGVIRFAGPVAGRGVVVIAHADGISTEYEPVRPAVRVGSRVRPGQPIGVVHGRHVGCTGCLHWGARRGEIYIDPLGLLRPLGPVVLLPWSADGSGG
ncbi:MAG TPA: M23 family metallopeptidase [Jatrophihabitans sp.]|jgi:murein DD-endopeptidase MepM/ murein hydrolase activator NlpD|nr:M23 family metallopeptidase [Jatrophihabitans sp.]